MAGLSSQVRTVLSRLVVLSSTILNSLVHVYSSSQPDKSSLSCMFRKGVKYQEKKKSRKAEYTRIKMITIPENSVLVGWGYLQRAGLGWSGTA